MLSITAFVLLASSIGLSSAQQTVYGQCGGIGWTGPTTCASGSTCVVSNPYYSQCIPGAATTAPATTTKPATTTATKTTTTATSVPTQPATKANYWFSFGDSYTQTGFNLTGTLPTVGNPLGNPPYPGFTASGGEDWIDFMTTKYNRSLVLTYNFAYGGATIDSNVVPPYTTGVLSLTDQVNLFLNNVANRTSPAAYTSSNSLFSIFIGINDVGNTYYQSNSTAINTELIGLYMALVSKLYSAGGRNFLFINVPAVDRSPLAASNGAAAQATWKAGINNYNSQLASAVSSFKSSNSGVSTWVYDSNTEFNTLLNNPTAYGFVDATSYGNTGDFWFNTYHPTAPVHDYMSQGIQKLLGNVIW